MVDIYLRETGFSYLVSGGLFTLVVVRPNGKTVEDLTPEKIHLANKKLDHILEYGYFWSDFSILAFVVNFGAWPIEKNNTRPSVMLSVTCADSYLQLNGWMGIVCI